MVVGQFQLWRNLKGSRGLTAMRAYCCTATFLAGSVPYTTYGYLLSSLCRLFGMPKPPKRKPHHRTNTPLDHIPAWVCGAAGGMIAALGQFIGQTFNEVIQHIADGETNVAMTQIGAFLIGTGLMAITGAVVAHFLQARTENRWALFLAGAAATSIGTTALPGFAKLVKRVDIAPITMAYASDGSKCDEAQFSLGTGVLQFFGLTKSGYRVVVGSFKDTNEAQALAEKINKQDSTLHAFVGERAPCNEFYPVIVGPATSTLAEAQKTETKVLKLESIPGAYISKRQY